MLAVVGAAKVPLPAELEAGHTWPDTVWLFACGLATCIAGLIGWRVGLRREDAAGVLSSLGPEGMLRLILKCRQSVQQILNEIESRPNIDPELVCDKIDNLLVNHFEPFVENRFILIEHYGMRKGAEILLQFSFVERYINRVWSATADGSPAEAKTSLQTAMGALEELSRVAETELQAL
jgi:hypothetical protein